MKTLLFPLSTQRLNGIMKCLLLFPFVLAGTASQFAHAQGNPFENLKTLAAQKDTLKQRAQGGSIGPSSAVWKAHTRAPIPYRPFELKDKAGRPIDPNQPVTLSNGRRLTARQLIDQLNAIESRLNASGYSLRNGETADVSEIVTAKEDLDGKAVPSNIGPLKSDAEVKKVMEPTKRVGELILKPYHEYSAEEKKNLMNFHFNEDKDQLKIQKLPSPIMAIPGRNLAPLKTINETSTNDWSFGRASSFRAGIHGELTRYARIYQFDPKNPFRNRSEFKVTGKANVYGDVLSRHMDLFNGMVEFYAPEDTARKMSGKIVVSVMGFTVLNLQRSFAQHQEFSGAIGRAIESSRSYSVHVVGPIDVNARIGVHGRVGLEYSGNVYRTFVSGSAKPLAELSGFIEGGAGISVAHAGVGSNLTFVKGELDLNAFAGVWIQNASQIVAAVSYYFGYDLEILKGKLYVYAEVCLPDWLGGGCSRYTTDVFNWSGFKRSGTIAEGSRTFVIANL